MKRKACFSLLFIIIFVFISALPVYADMGPQASIKVTVKGVDSESYYITLLCDPSSDGYSPSSGETDKSGVADWQKLRDYVDADGYKFDDRYAQYNSENGEYIWSYYPIVQQFKVLIYDFDTDTYAVSEICTRYAYSSYFDVSPQQSNVQTTLSVKVSYNLFEELSDFTVRLISTIILEILIALLCGIKHKKVLLFIVLINVITQIGLNIALNTASPTVFDNLVLYLALEIVITVIEAVAYTFYFKKYIKTKRFFPALYSLAANTASFLCGLAISLFTLLF